MYDFFKKIENWLDKKNNELDRRHYYLKFSKNSFHKLLWKWLFKSKKNNLDILRDSCATRERKKSRARKVIHVINLVLPESLKDQNLANRISITLDSIKRATNEKVTLLACTTDDIKLEGWKVHKLKRSAKSELGLKKDFAYLRDMLIAANNIAEKGDVIFYSNADCPVHPDIYNCILEKNNEAAEFIRQDVDQVASYEDLFSKPFEHYEIGVDAISIKKESLNRLLKLLPDFIIGEPHWDTAVSGIFHKNFDVTQDLNNLYHIKHPQQWSDDDLSIGGKHNKKLYRNCVNYGLMEDDLISIKKDCAIILLNDSSKQKNTPKLIRQLQLISDEYTRVFCEYLKEGKSFKKHVTGVGYLPIAPTNDNVKALSQRGAIVNLLVNYFVDHKYIIIILNGDLSMEGVKKIKSQLKQKKRIQTSDYLAINTEKNKERMFDFFLENNQKFPNISSCSFINDDGLLQLFDNYGYFQSLNLPGKRT